MSEPSRITPADIAVIKRSLRTLKSNAKTLRQTIKELEREIKENPCFGTWGKLNQLNDCFSYCFDLSIRSIDEASQRRQEWECGYRRT